MRMFLFLFLFFNLSAFANSHIETIDAELGGNKIKVELALTPEQQEKGLMGRTELGKNRGMLFIFSSPRELHFWMKDTLIPLSIGFFDKEKKFIKYLEMDPISPLELKPKSYSSGKPAMYALEMQKGWFKKNGIKKGEKLLLPNLVK